jgi:hypothetical protein
MGSSPRRFSCRVVIRPGSSPAPIDHLLRDFPRFLGIDFEDQNGIMIHSVHDPPIVLTIANPKRPTAMSDDRQWLGHWHPEAHALLKKPKKIAGLLATFFSERRRFDFPVQPRQRFSLALLVRFSSDRFFGHRAILARPGTFSHCQYISYTIYVNGGIERVEHIFVTLQEGRVILHGPPWSRQQQCLQPAGRHVHRPPVYRGSLVNLM